MRDQAPVADELKKENVESEQSMPDKVSTLDRFSTLIPRMILANQPFQPWRKSWKTLWN
jgi:hypothetical protein